MTTVKKKHRKICFSKGQKEWEKETSIGHNIPKCECGQTNR